jgi:hypothetical protein
LLVDSAYLWGYTSLKLDQNGQPHLAYCDGGSVKYASNPSTAAAIPPTGGSLISSFDQTTYTFAPGTFTDTVTLTHIPHLSGEAPSGGHLAGIGHVFEIVAVYDSTSQPAQPTRPYTVTVAHADSEKGPAIESTLALYYWDATQWAREPTSVVDTEANTVTVTPHHFGLWAVLGETRRTFLPMVLGHQSSGAPR